MVHLTPEELVDLAEGTRDEGAAPHLATCATCRQQLADLRVMMAEVNAADVPEPSPLFWDHFSRRVSEAVAADGRTPLRGRSRWSYANVLGWANAVGAAAAIAALVVGLRFAPTASHAPSPADPIGRETLADIPDDASLSVVATMTTNLDPELAGEAGLAGTGTADHAVTHLTDDELRELGRLLRQEMARPGA